MEKCYRSRIVYSIFMLATSLTLSAQWGITFMPGKIIRHTENLRYDIPDRPLGLALKFRLKDNKNPSWHRYYGYPEVDLHAGYQSFNDPTVLGSAFYLYPEIRFFPFSDRLLITPMISLGTGLAYLNKKYSLEDNPNNNSISSHINNATGIAMGFRYSPFPGHNLSAGVRLTHFSNAKFSSPNLGINVLSLDIGYTYLPATNDQTSSCDRENESTSRYWFLEAAGVYSLNEYAVPGGPKFPSFTTGIMFGWPISRHQSLLLFPFWQTGQVDRVFGESVFLFENEEAAERSGQKWSLALGLESRFNRLAVSIFTGLYLAETEPGASSPIFNLIRLQYLIPISDNWVISPGLQFKSQQITAEYIGLLLAFRLRNKCFHEK